MSDAFAPPPPVERVPLLNKRTAALGFTISFTVLAWVCSLLRVYARFFILREPWWDDLFMALALITSTIGSVVFCILAGLGEGKHFTDMTVYEANDYMKAFYIGSATYPMALTFIKLALLFQYLRIFDMGSKRRRFCKGLIIFTSIWGIFFCIPTWVPCYPVPSMWDLSPESKATRHCWGFASRDLPEVLGFLVTQSVTTTVIDLIIFFLPLHLFFQAGTQKKTRIALLCLLLLGLCVSLCSIARLVYSLTPTLDAIWDLSWNTPTPTGLATIEINLASVCAALPVFWPVMKDGWTRIFVTYEVSVTRESGIFIPRRLRKNKIPPRSASSDLELTTGDPPKFETTEQQQLEWDPYVGDSKTGLGESDTIVQSPAQRPDRAVIREKRSFMNVV